LNSRCGGQASANSGGFIPRKEKKKKRAAKNLRKLVLSLSKENLPKKYSAKKNRKSGKNCFDKIIKNQLDF
jgi:hypothetical protein